VLGRGIRARSAPVLPCQRTRQPQSDGLDGGPWRPLPRALVDLRGVRRPRGGDDRRERLPAAGEPVRRQQVGRRPGPGRLRSGSAVERRGVALLQCRRRPPRRFHRRGQEAGQQPDSDPLRRRPGNARVRCDLRQRLPDPGRDRRARLHSRARPRGRAHRRAGASRRRQSRQRLQPRYGRGLQRAGDAGAGTRGHRPGDPGGGSATTLRRPGTPGRQPGSRRRGARLERPHRHSPDARRRLAVARGQPAWIRSRQGLPIRSISEPRRSANRATAR
jgi:hypothetical protein